MEKTASFLKTTSNNEIIEKAVTKIFDKLSKEILDLKKYWEKNEVLLEKYDLTSKVALNEFLKTFEEKLLNTFKVLKR